MAGGVGKGVQADITMLSPVNDARLAVIFFVLAMAKDAALGFLRAGDVRVSPGSPEIVHRSGKYRLGATLDRRLPPIRCNMLRLYLAQRRRQTVLAKNG